MGRTGTEPSMPERDADKSPAGTLGQPRRVGGGTAESTRHARQAGAAGDDHAGDRPQMTREEVLRRENMLQAYQRVVKNGGAPGIDGMTVEAVEQALRDRWEGIRNELLSDRYQPQPVRKVEIPKPDGGGKRTLGIPTVIDRMIQQSLLQVMQPHFDATFSEGSFGFRPGRSAQQAALRAREHIAAGYRWVVDMDLEKFFDRVNHDVLMARLARRVKDKRILRLIRRYLTAGMMDGGVVSPRTEGTPQGGPLSPLLSNILLDELDRELERRGHRFVRYADDCNIYVRSQKAGERVLESVERFLAERLRLKVNREKSAVDRPWNRKFLGYTVLSQRHPKLRVAPAAVKRLKGRLRGMLRPSRGRSLGRTITELTLVLRGWVAYFRKVEVKATFEGLDQWIRRKLRVILWRQWKRSKTRFKELVKRGLDQERARLAAGNGRGPWWNAGASHMNRAVPTSFLHRLGLVSLLQEHQRLACLS